MQIFLFDIDGVLIQQRGYRQGVDLLIREFADRWGFRGNLPGEEEINLLESLRVTNEWDHIPICLACILEEGLALIPFEGSNFSLKDITPEVMKSFSVPLRIDYRRKIQAIGSLDGNAGAISDRLLETDSIFPRLFPHRAYRDLFAHTRDVQRSWITRRFQLLELGSRYFRSAYRIEPEFECEGLLLSSDISMLPAETAAGLLQRRETGELRIAAMTARPSVPDGLDADGYSPEAQLGLQLAGLAGVPCIGFGELCWLADQTRAVPDAFLKPHRVHALAAIAAACGMDGRSAMQTAYRADADGAAEDFRFLSAGSNGPVEITIFEDTPVGVISARAAVEHLNEMGIPAVFHARGIARNEDKRAALEALGASVFPSIREALAATLT